VRIDTSGDRARQPNLVFDLEGILIQCNGPLSLFKEIVPLSYFPNLVVAAKAYLYDCVRRFENSTKIRSDVTQNFNNIIRLFIWMIQQRGIYRLDALTRRDFDDVFADLVKHGGWHSLFNLDDSLRSLIERLQAGSLEIEDICPDFGNRTKVVSLRANAIEELCGIPRSNDRLPTWFYDALLPFHPAGFVVAKSGKPDALSYMGFYSIVKSWNRLYHLPDSVDKPDFLPVPDPQTRAIALAKSNAADLRQTGGRTQNISLGDTIKLFKESLLWIYEYADGILSVLNIYREAAELLVSERAREGSTLRILPKRTRREFDRRIVAECRKHNLPFDTIVPSNQTLEYDVDRRPCIDDVIQKLQSACFTLSATNLGRRLNEVVGQDNLPYGFYFGCITTDSEFPHVHFIDIYVEKTLQDWSRFYVSKLVRDCVSTLEKLSQVLRPAFSAPKKRAKSTAEARGDKLFVTRTLTANGLVGGPASYSYARHGTTFLRAAGVGDLRLDNRAHPFRRMFALLYYYRYDDARLLPLQHHLRHFDLGMTVTYVSDSAMRADADKIERLFRKRRDEHIEQEMAVLDDVKSEAFHHAVLRVFRGELAGGNWPRIVLLFYRMLAKSSEFQFLALDAQADKVAEALEAKGYSRVPYEHGGCNKGNNTRTRRLSKCHQREEDREHTEDASRALCQQCVHHDSGEFHQTLLLEDIEDLRKQIAAKEVPTDLKRHLKVELSGLEEVLNAERKMEKSNRELLGTVIRLYAMPAQTKEN
jgi:hypothetical protein